VAELVRVVVYELCGFLSVWCKEERDRAGGVWARKQIGINRVRAEQNRDGIVASQVRFRERL